MTDRIYLDCAATTPLHPEARAAMQPWLTERFGNPSSIHAEGRGAKEALDKARETLSASLGCLFGEVLFTGSGTEAANIAIVGAALAHEGNRRRVLLGASEHQCVLNTRPILERLGYTVETIPVDRYARPDLAALDKMIGDDVLLASVMHANNEVGSVNDVAAAFALVKPAGAIFHCDAVQTFPWLNGNRWTVDEIGADLINVSAHKLGGPKGVGALYVRAGTKLKPLTAGGGQEREMRAGTENVAGAVGFAAAIHQAVEDKDWSKRKSAAKAAFIEQLQREDVPKFNQTVEDAEVLAGHLHIRFPGVPAESMLIRLDRMGVAISSGSACSSGAIEPSHVLLAAGWDQTAANEGLRITFGCQTTVEEATEAAKRTAEAARRIATEHART